MNAFLHRRYLLELAATDLSELVDKKIKNNESSELKEYFSEQEIKNIMK